MYPAPCTLHPAPCTLRPAAQVSCVCMVMYDAHAISSRHLLVGFRSWAWLTVFLSALGGIAVSMVG